MSVQRLYIKKVYRIDPNTDVPKDERILWIDDAAGLAAMIEVLDPKASLHFVDCHYLEERLKDETLIPTTDPYQYLMLPDEAYGKTRLQERDANAAAMAVLTDAEPEILYDRKERGKLIRQIANRDLTDPTHRNRKTVFELLRRFWQRGANPNAFLTDRHLGDWHRKKRETDPAKQEIAQGLALLRRTSAIRWVMPRG